MLGAVAVDAVARLVWGLPVAGVISGDWQVETCTGTPGQSNYSCRRERYVCRDGRYGSNGSIGRDGATGQDGQLRLVNQLEPLISDTPTQTLTLQEFASRPHHPFTQLSGKPAPGQMPC